MRLVIIDQFPNCNTAVISLGLSMTWLYLMTNLFLMAQALIIYIATFPSRTSFDPRIWSPSTAFINSAVSCFIAYNYSIVLLLISPVWVPKITPNSLNEWNRFGFIKNFLYYSRLLFPNKINLYPVTRTTNGDEQNILSLWRFVRPIRGSLNLHKCLALLPSSGPWTMVAPPAYNHYLIPLI